jgi:hypothetical protein
MEASQGPTTSYILSLIGGLIVLLYSLFSLVMFALYGPYWGGIGGWMTGMMGSYHDFMGIYGASTEFLAAISILGLVSGVVMVIGAAMLRAHPKEHTMWGTVIIVFSAISFLGMGGFFIGALLGIIGGAFAISYRPRAAT